MTSVFCGKVLLVYSFGANGSIVVEKENRKYIDFLIFNQ